MINEAQVLKVVQSVTDTNAYFSNGTLFLETVNSNIAVEVFNAIWEKITAAVAFGKFNEKLTTYDFLG
jgi:hypothetical protein